MHILFLIYIKLYQLNIIKKIKKDYKKKARERNQNFSKVENKKSECYKTLSEDKRQNFVEYRKKCYKTRKKLFIMIIR